MVKVAPARGTVLKGGSIRKVETLVYVSWPWHQQRKCLKTIKVKLPPKLHVGFPSCSSVCCEEKLCFYKQSALSFSWRNKPICNWYSKSSCLFINFFLMNTEELNFLRGEVEFWRLLSDWTVSSKGVGQVLLNAISPHCVMTSTK